MNEQVVEVVLQIAVKVAVEAATAQDAVEAVWDEWTRIQEDANYLAGLVNAGATLTLLTVDGEEEPDAHRD